MAMNPEVKAKWLAALRSGKYQQGKGELRSQNNTFCCLGALCDLHSPDRWIAGDDGEGPFCYDEIGEFELPPKSVKEWAGFDWVSVYVWIGKDYRTLYDHNDAGRTFAEIADAIEAQL